MRSLLPPLLLALAWGVGPALPTLLRGELLGHGLTDLYPSVWGLWLFAEDQPGLPSSTRMLGFPVGMGFYYSSPLKGWIAALLLPFLSLPAAWNLLTLASRVATVLCAWGAARAWGAGGAGALAVAGLYGCAPFFHGYAVEGLAEGTDGWTLALAAWLLGRGHHRWAGVGLALTILSSWYLGMCGVLLACLAALRDRKALATLFIGVGLSLPAVEVFRAAFATDAAPDAVQAAMGARPAIPRPGLLEGLQPFARTAYVGWLALAAALLSRSRLALLALIPAILSLGAGPWYDLPVLSWVRFPYRWHAATLALLAPAVALAADRRRWWWLGPAIAAEGLLLSPIEPLIPGAAAEIPRIYAQVDGPLLEVPGPLARPPGEPNPARSRLRYLLYYQAGHGRPSPWRPDFNGLARGGQDRALLPFESWDPQREGEPAPIGAAEVNALRELGIDAVMLQRAELGRERTEALAGQLEAAGARVIAQEGGQVLLSLRP